MLALIVVGFVGYSRMPVDLMPNINPPYVSVTTVYPGASPDEVQRSTQGVYYIEITPVPASSFPSSQ